MTALNLKAVASAFAALALTAIVSWTFLNDAGLARVQGHTNPTFVAAVSALVR